MENVEINLIAVLIASTLHLFVQAVCYGPVFGKVWLKLAHIENISLTEKKANYALSIVFSLAIAYMLAFILSSLGEEGVISSLLIGFMLWFSFVLGTHFLSVAWSGKKKELFFIDSVAHLAGILAASFVLGVF